MPAETNLNSHLLFKKSKFDKNKAGNLYLIWKIDGSDQNIDIFVHIWCLIMRIVDFRRRFDPAERTEMFELGDQK